MSSNNTPSMRATRSRYSSPLAAANGAPDSSSSSSSSSSKGAQGNGTSTTNGVDGQKAFMQRWLEPPVQVKASYQDAGLVRQGVFENMAPLGTLPKVGLFKKTAPPPAAAPQHPPARTRIVIKNKPSVLPAPKPAPPPAPGPEEDETEEDATEPEAEDDEMTEEQDDEDLGEEDQALAANKDGHKARTTAASQCSRRSVASRETDDEDWAPGTPAQKATTRRNSSRASTRPPQQLVSGASAASRPVDPKEFGDRVVEAAVDEALAHFRYPTAWALRTLYDENSSNHEFLIMIQKVFLQTANADELEDFARLIHAKKKEGRKDNKACHYFVPAAANSGFTPHQPKRAPYGNLVKFDMSTLRLDKDSGKSQTQKRERPVEIREPAAEEQPAEREPEPELPPRKKRKAGRQHREATPSSSKMAATNGVNGKAATETPSRRRARARSVSSTSSLSSALSLSPPDGIQEVQDGGDQGFDETPSRNSPAPPQPITAGKRRRSNAPRKSRNVSPSGPSPPAVSTTTPAPQQLAGDASSSQQPSHRQSPAAEQPTAAQEEQHQPYEMPAVVDSPLFPNLNSKKGSKSGTPALVIASKVGKIDPNDENLLLRQTARSVTNQPLPVSNVRGSSPQVASAQAEREVSSKTATPATAPAERARTSLPSGRPTPAPREGRSTRSAVKRTHDDLEDQPSPTAANFPGSEAASTAADSRAGTPALRPAKKPRTGLRVKNSPMKKRNGTSAGIPRPSGERSSPLGNAPREDDNDDYCSSCGGNGELICCDGCTRSFHFSCVDPVLRRDAMPVEWFCNVCRANRDPAHQPTHGGAFALLLEKLDARNSSAFRLPGPIRDRFEGVRTGVDGEYEEVATNVVKPTRKKKNEDDQAPDFFRLRDADGNAAICHSCQKGSGTDRAIIPCSICGLYWHLDCLDPPVAYPPVLRTWRCPLHADDLLAQLPSILHPAHRYRKVKDVPVIRPAFTRGYVNNGFVDIELEDDENESGWNDVESFGRTVRLSEQGIMLDFISRAREQRIREQANAQPQAPAKPLPVPMELRSLEEQRAVLNLAQLGMPRDDGVSVLVEAMISQAEPSVIDMMARADPSHLENNTQLNQMDQQSLRAILARAESMTEHIRQLLASATPAQPLPQTTAPAEAEDAAGTVPSLSNSQSPSNNSANMDSDPIAMDFAAAKSPASPATTDDVPAMTQGEKTPVLGDQSPAAPLPLRLEETATPMENGGVPPTPTKAAGIPGEEPVVLEAGGEGEKGLGVGEAEGLGVE